VIPRVAYFYWGGNPLPWLCAQSMETFRRHHPGWEIVLGSPDLETAPHGVRLERDTVTDPRLPPQSRADVWRWHALQGGGWWSDMDVLYARNVEPLLSGKCDAWVTTDGGHALPGAKGVPFLDPVSKQKKWLRPGLSIGAIGCRQGSELARRCFAAASVASPSDDYQSHGTSLLTAQWRGLTAGLILGALPFRVFFTGASQSDVQPLWAEGAKLASEAYGVHWYGGSPESTRFVGAQSVDELPDCPVRQAIDTLALSTWSPRKRVEPMDPHVEIGPGERALAEWIAAETRGTGSTLDVGTGQGRYLQFSRSELRIGLDAQRPGFGDLRIHGDALEVLPLLGTGSVDVVMSTDFLEHLERPASEAALDHMTRIARKRVLVFTPSGFRQQHPGMAGSERFTGEEWQWQTHRCGWTRGEFEARGFVVEGWMWDLDAYPAGGLMATRSVLS